KGYKIRFDMRKEGGRVFLHALFFAHKSAIVQAHRFPEVVSIDVTYKTNKHRMPFVNAVGVGNIGFPKLSSFCIAGGWLSEETGDAYT
ncbi:hypothetical protein DFQ30_005834, partial [Apophysomyces sp. BC1015]